MSQEQHFKHVTGTAL